MSPAPILVYGRDVRLLETRAWVLQQAGFRVLCAMDLIEVKEFVRTEPVKVLVLCHTLSPAERVDALRATAGLRPGVQRMVMTANALTIPDEGQEGTLSVYDGPRKLIEVVESLAGRTDAQG